MSLQAIRELLQSSDRHYLGAVTASEWSEDPRHLAFKLARYKFVAKMLDGYDTVLEVGCGDAFASTLVAQSVAQLVGVDVEPYVVQNVADSPVLRQKATILQHDIVAAPLDRRFGAVYALDVLEHIPPLDEARFLQNIVDSTEKPGVLIIGTPNLDASAHASPGSQLDHVNLKSHSSLKETLLGLYQQVFIFGMNDEVLHTGFGPMCHYLMALAVGVRS